jgi:hypothetical protein
MACTNRRCGWPGYRWGRGPDWATTGVIRPVAEITGSVDVTVDDFTGEWAHQQFVDPAVAEESTRCAVWCSAAVVDLAGCEPAIGHHQVSAVAGGLVGQLRPDRTHCRVGDGPPVGAPLRSGSPGSCLPPVAAASFAACVIVRISTIMRPHPDCGWRPPVRASPDSIHHGADATMGTCS